MYVGHPDKNQEENHQLTRNKTPDFLSKKPGFFVCPFFHDHAVTASDRGVGMNVPLQANSIIANDFVQHCMLVDQGFLMGEKDGSAQWGVDFT